MVRGNKGQVAMEYMMIFAISAALAIPLIFIFVSQQQYLQADVNQAQLEKSSYQLEAAAREVFYLGPPSQKAIEITFPRGVHNVIFGTDYMQFNVTFAETTYLYTKDFAMNITGEVLPYSGVHFLVVQATASGVNITER